MSTKKGKLLYEGRFKKLYSTDAPDECILHFKDGVTAGSKETKVKNKGAYAATISATLFKFLESYQISLYHKFA